MSVLKTEKTAAAPDLAQQRIQRLLLQTLAEAKLKNPFYSLRAFAKKIKLSPAAVSEILNGKRAISLKIADRILDQLDADPELRREISSLFRQKGTQKSTEEKSISDTFTKVSLEQFRTIADWYHFAILSLFETKDFKVDPETISRRLGIKKAEVVQALQRLERLEMIRQGDNGELQLTGKQFQTVDGVASSAIRLSHFQSLELAKKSLELDPTNLRDFTSLTMAVDPNKMELAKKMIRQFYMKLARELEVDPKGEVYMLNIGLFPLSRTVLSQGGNLDEK